MFQKAEPIYYFVIEILRVLVLTLILILVLYLGLGPTTTAGSRAGCRDVLLYLGWVGLDWLL